jgi:integrase
MRNVIPPDQWVKGRYSKWDDWQMDFRRSDEVYDWGKENRKAVSDKKIENQKSLSDSSYKTYKSDFHSICRLAGKLSGKTKITQIKPNDMYQAFKYLKEEAIHKKEISPYTVRKYDDAVHFFVKYSKESGVYKNQMRIGDKRKIEEILKDKSTYRKAKDSKVAPLMRDDVNKIVKELEKSRSPYKNQAIDALHLEFLTGKRISSILNAKAGNYKSDLDMFKTVGDKGNKTNPTFMLRVEAKQILDRLSQGKKAGTHLFTMKHGNNVKDKNKRNQDKSVESMYKTVDNLLNNTIKKMVKKGALVPPEGKKFTTHSFRKGHAVENSIQYVRTFNTYTLAKNELERRQKIDPGLTKRINSELVNIRAKHKIKENAKKREFTYLELIKLLISTDINHSRVSVVRFYSDLSQEEFKEALKYADTERPSD